MLKKTVTELKVMLKAKGLTVQGKKEILIERLAKALTLDEGVNGGGESAAKKQCRRKDELVVELERDSASPGSGFEEAIASEDVADAVDGTVPAEYPTDEDHADEDVDDDEDADDDKDADEEEEFGDSDHEEGCNSFFDKLLLPTET